MNSNKQLLRQKPKLFMFAGYRSKSGWLSTLHSHNFCELMFVNHGSGKIRIDNDTYPFESGDVVVYNPGTKHVEFIDDVLPCEIRFLRIAKLNMDGYEKGCLCHGAFALLKTGEHKENFSFYLSRLFEEKASNATQSSKICENLLNIIISYIVRFSHDKNSFYEDKETFLKIRTFLDEHFVEDLSIDDICQQLFVSKYYLTHLFKDTAGVPPLKYVTRKRIALAKNLLETTDDKVDKIAKTCGYADVAYFGRIFKKTVGVSPLSYRKAILELKRIEQNG